VLILVVTALPFMVLAFLVVAPLLGFVLDLLGVDDAIVLVGSAAPDVILFLASAYWLGVLTLAKSPHAWRIQAAHAPSASTSDPFFVRAVDTSARRFRFLRIFGTDLYVRLARRVIGDTHRPASVAEHAGYEVTGLAFARAVVSFPGVYLMLRPLIPVASTMIIAARAPHALRVIDPPRVDKAAA
jgi:hypothetical protein